MTESLILFRMQRLRIGPTRVRGVVGVRAEKVWERWLGGDMTKAMKEKSGFVVVAEGVGV